MRNWKEIKKDLKKYSPLQETQTDGYSEAHCVERRKKKRNKKS